MNSLHKDLRALADKTRISIIELLSRHDFCVRALAQRLGLSEATTSQHLKTLREAGFVQGEKVGYFVHYRVDQSRLHAIADCLHELASLARSDNPCMHHHHTERRGTSVCKCQCQHPEKRPADGKCSAELIRACHGDEAKHSCEEEET